MPKTSNVIYKYVEHELCHLEYYKKELGEERNRIIERSSVSYGARSSKTGTSQTEQKALTLLTSIYIKKLEKTIEALESAINKLEDTHFKIYNMYYKNSINDMLLICDELHISPETFYRKKREIIKICAVELGLIGSP